MRLNPPRRDCTCECHIKSGIMHVAACCIPDEIYDKLYCDRPEYKPKKGDVP